MKTMGKTRGLELRWIQGSTNQNIEFVGEKTVCYLCGSHICFLNLETKDQRVLESPGRGAGALTASGISGIFAFSERKLEPTVFIYSFPDLKLKQQLKGGALLDYTLLALSDGGPYLAGCSSVPAFTITIWNWESAESLCSLVQRGCDVVSLAFNPLNWLQFSVLGTSFITVWNIEKSVSTHVLKPSVIQLPAADGSFVEQALPPLLNANMEFTYYGPEMPPSSVSGVSGDDLESVWADLCSKPSLTPVAICWTTSSELYVGCQEGFLLLLDAETHAVSVVFDPTAPAANPELKQRSFQGLSLDRNGLIAVKKDRTVHRLIIKGTQVTIAQTWRFETPICAAMFSPDYETLLFTSSTGQIYRPSTGQSEGIVKVLDVLSGNFLAATFCQSSENICVSVREGGQLQLWSADGMCLGSLPLHVQATSLACCPSAAYAALGTASGQLLFIDLTEPRQPRLVHHIRLYHSAVQHIVFDQTGHFLLTAATDPNIYVLNARASLSFSVVGYTVVAGPVLSLSARYIAESRLVQVLTLCPGHERPTLEGCLLSLFTLSAENLAERHGRLSDEGLNMLTYEVPHPVSSCVLGLHSVFAYCHRRKTLQLFQLPQDAEARHETVELKQTKEVKGHPLGPATLVLSPDQRWLASLGRDGSLQIRDTSSMDHHVEKQSHSSGVGGVQSVSFSPDSHSLLTAGFEDGCLVCSQFRFEDADSNTATDLNEMLSSENSVLRGLPEWESPDEFVDRNKMDGEEVNVTKHEDSCDSPSRLTWLEIKHNRILQEDDEQYSVKKENLRKRLQELRDAVQDMVSENENASQMEQMDLQQFNLDVDGQRRLDAMVAEEVMQVLLTCLKYEMNIVRFRLFKSIFYEMQVKSEIEQKIQEKDALCAKLKKELWDSMMVKGRAVRAFHSDHEVKNFALTERTTKQLEDLRRVEHMRMLEKAAIKQQNSGQERLHDPTSGSEVKQGEGREVLTSSYSAQLGCSHPDLYDQLTLQTTDQRINQIILLQDVIHRVKTAFNNEFDAVHRQKVQEISHVRDRNRQIREIMAELELKEDLWEPEMTVSEMPERLFSVDNHEIETEKFLTPEQRQEEERKRQEEQKRLNAERDESRDRALEDMMAGVLEVKTQGFLKLEIPPPEFVLTKPDIHWTDEEKKLHQEFEKKSKVLCEEKEKYRKSLETEMKKLQASTAEFTEKFDGSVRRLFEMKIRSQMAVYQEELKIICLKHSIHLDEAMRNREVELTLKLEQTLALKEQLGNELMKQEQEVALFRESYESVLAEDRILDKDFRKEFLDLPRVVVDHLYKLFKRRPRVQKLRTENSSKPFKEQTPCASQGPDAFDKMLKAMEELDAKENMPEGLNPSVWERFCHVRRAKAASEQKVRVNALTMAEMQAFLQRRNEENMAAEQQIQTLNRELESSLKTRNMLQMDTMVQALLKQGQVEVPITDLAPDYSGAVLLHRSVVEDLNRTIQALGEQKIATMEETKELRKGLIQMEWENKKRRMQIEDLKIKARDIQMLRLTEDQKEYLNKIDRDSRVSKQVSTLKKTIEFHKKAHFKAIEKHRLKIKQLKSQAGKKAEENAELDQQIQGMEVTVSELRHIWEATAFLEAHSTKRPAIKATGKGNM
ncbi:cilia- and flagella-associated protein 43 isoform X5 [Synchiropus splendidus]|uniref:cilia- and flagella-associated protein 43 isoform X5 n=1 Tax=Synchiropus splendidus TaxID=270530 RepID=UPI00237D64BA|nr:cilia- and flagella-associated protein 43 isoform X5 [Synchiropus splendidus]